MRKKNLNGLRKCSGEGRSHHLFYTLDTEEETSEDRRKPTSGGATGSFPRLAVGETRCGVGGLWDWVRSQRQRHVLLHWRVQYREQ